MITAHSGCDGTVPNSTAYLRHALHTGADALEIDIRRSAGGLVLSHDMPEETADPVTLEEAFRILAGSSMKINCDLKIYDLEEDVLKTAEETGIGRGRLILTGSVTDCMHARQRLGDLCVFINAEELIPGFYEPFLAGHPDPDTFRILAERCRAAEMDVININYRVCTDELFGICREAGIALSVWTVDETGAMERMLTKGVRNLTTRMPSEALRMKDRIGKRLHRFSNSNL